ncbi:hypothetical protein D3C86_2007050 [compost metagenome]
MQGHEYARSVDWVTGQCYVIDIFLWFMARRGYTLQRSRAKVPFRDLHEDVENARMQRLSQGLPSSTQPSKDGGAEHD